ncbi:hypothetical protein M5J20_00330 [Corynebacterium sp. TA-R-1]|uniref:Antitoxin VbhA domain-containing protein n=1 Tax=Corynebacterium stercoris TaxID=2943490 RepID=A0ABT1FYD6_9CORY|nr:hypothetical protein [Corynebacterium stercoris]MCP1386647.1 hypothetical protein [Corynebacterium stercoris]
MTQIIGQTDVQDILRFSDGVLAAAGHTVTNPEVDRIRELAASGAIDADEAISLIRELYAR